MEYQRKGLEFPIPDEKAVDSAASPHTFWMTVDPTPTLNTPGAACSTQCLDKNRQRQNTYADRAWPRSFSLL